MPGRLGNIVLLALAALVMWPSVARSQAARAGSSPAASAGRAAVRSGSIPTHDGYQLTLTADTGSVHIFSDAAGEVRYQVFVADEPNGAAAFGKDFSLRARVTARGVILNGRAAGLHGIGSARVNYEVHVPRRYNLVIFTQAGDIVAQDIDGRVALKTGGGNIQAGRVGRAAGSGGRNEFAARLESGGGHIFAGNIAGSLRAWTGGGHITAGNVDGNAVLHTGGGHIQVGRVQGSAQLTTGGGNIVAERAGDGVVAQTTGGRIEFAEAAGAIHVRTGGGGVRIGRVAGPTEMESADGGIFLAGVDAPLHVSTTAGAITAQFSRKFRGWPAADGPVTAASAEGGSELASGQGDIVVYVPREMALTIDALIERGSEHRILADPSFALKVHSEGFAGGHSLRAQVALNGGGSVLRLKTGAGDIQLRFLDADIERRLAAQQAAIVEHGLAGQKAMSLEMARQTSGAWEEQEIAGRVTQGQPQEPSQAAAAPPLPGGLLAITRLLESFWWGGVRVDPEEQQKRLRQTVRPEYPEGAREAGLEGDVTLRVEIGPDGLVKDVRLLSGDPELARAAANAVAQWRYAPALLDRRPVSVVTTVTVAFRLR